MWSPTDKVKNTFSALKKQLIFLHIYGIIKRVLATVYEKSDFLRKRSMIFMKKIITVILAAMMCVGLASCGAQQTKDYVIATDKGFSPFEFQDADGNIVGIDMDILKAIAEDQNFTYDLQYVGWDAAIAACQAGQADGMIAGASITDERKASGWIFSDGYYDATQGMAVAKSSSIKGFDELNGKKVAVKNGTMSNKYAESIKEQYGFEVVTFSTSPDMYQAVIGGQVDACIDDTPILKYNIKIGELDMVFVDGTENEPAQYGMAIFDGNKQELIEKFNAGLKNIKASGKYDEIIEKYVG